MKKRTWYIIGGALVLTLAYMAKDAIFTTAGKIIQQFEGFSPVPYWDVSRYSWGYGTPAPGPTGTITREQAFQELTRFNQDNYNYLRPMITRPLNYNQWAALLSFAYNLGPGNADNLVPNINAGDLDALGTQWNKYVYSGGTVNPVLVKRRAKEWELFNTV